VAYLPVAVTLGSLGQTLKRSLPLARQAGADAVEIDARRDVRPGELSGTGIRQLRKSLEEMGLRVAAVRFFSRRGYGVAEDSERRIDASRQAAQMAYDLGAANLVIHAGSIAEEPTDPSFALMQEVLTDLGSWSHRVGTRLLAKTDTQPISQLARLFEELPDGTLGVAFDPAALLIGGQVPHEAVRHVATWLEHVYANDATRDLSGGQGLPTRLGQGSVDWPAMLGALSEVGYQKYLCVQREAGETSTQHVAEAIQYMRALQRSA